MSAESDQLAEVSLDDVRRRREHLDDMEEQHARAKLRFIRNARAAGWSWERIGNGLGLTDRGASSYWANHRMEASRMGG